MQYDSYDMVKQIRTTRRYTGRHNALSENMNPIPLIFPFTRTDILRRILKHIEISTEGNTAVQVYSARHAREL